MKVQKIQPNTVFEARKRRFIDLESHEQLRDILTKMNNESVYEADEYSFTSDSVAKLSLIDSKKEVELIDHRFILGKLPEKNQMQGETVLNIGKLSVAIENKSGEILKCNKSFFQTWDNVIHKIGDFLLEFNNNFHKPDVVKKHHFSIKGFTKKGYEKLQQILRTK